MYEIGGKQNPTITPSHTNRLDSQLAQNLGLMLIARNYDSIEDQALYSLSSFMKDYLVEVGTQMRQLSESQGRTETNLIDALNVAYDYGSDQQEMQNHF